MRNNQPVTQKDYKFPDHYRLISSTDKRGIITYCNDAFVEVSGFDREELLNKNHNLVRHPDMPEGVFKEMWQTLQAGRIWMGLVKNRHVGCESRTFNTNTICSTRAPVHSTRKPINIIRNN